MQAHVKREKAIQAECSSCWMVNLVSSFKDTAYLYMLLECIMGGELFTYLQVSCSCTACASALHLSVRLVCTMEGELFMG